VLSAGLAISVVRARGFAAQAESWNADPVHFLQRLSQGIVPAEAT
jgi:hypothetical protein